MLIGLVNVWGDSYDHVTDLKINTAKNVLCKRIFRVK